MDHLIEKIANARSDAQYNSDRGDTEKAVVSLTIGDCAALSTFFTKAYGAVMTGSRSVEISPSDIAFRIVRG